MNIDDIFGICILASSVFVFSLSLKYHARIKEETARTEAKLRR